MTHQAMPSGSVQFAVTLRHIIVALALVAAGGAGASDGAPDKPAASDQFPHIGLWAPAQSRTEINGEYVPNSASGRKGGMMYPAPNLVGFLAVVATHGVIEGVVADSKRDKQIEAADKILTPYRAVLDLITNQELINGAVPELSADVETRMMDKSSVPASNEVQIEATPSILITQDLRSVIVVASVSMRNYGEAEFYKNVIRAISLPGPAENPGDYWFADQAKNLKHEAARLIAQTIEAALVDQYKQPQDKVYKTVHYLAGASERIERAEIVSTHCDQMVLRTLRGNLMAVHIRPADVSPENQCLTGDKVIQPATPMQSAS